VDEGVVERGVDVGDGEHLLTLANLRSERDLDLLNLLLLSLTWSHFSRIGSIYKRLICTPETCEKKESR